MSRPLRLEYEGAVYHIIARGNEKREIFQDVYDYQMFLKILLNVVLRYGWKLYAYILMNNHYHLLIETIRANLSNAMHELQTVYSKKYNYRHNRIGHLFQRVSHAVKKIEERKLVDKLFFQLLTSIELKCT